MPVFYDQVTQCSGSVTFSLVGMTSTNDIPTIPGIKFWIAHDRTRPPLGTSKLWHLHLFLPETDCILPQYLSYVFHLPSSEGSKKSYKPCVITEGRIITGKVHQKLYNEKEEIKARKEKEKEGRKRPRDKKQETKLLEGENKNLKQ